MKPLQLLSRQSRELGFHRLRASLALDHGLIVTDHVRRFLRAALHLGEQHELADLRLARNARTFGYRGHCFTKSRRYSTTFKALREARERHVHEQLLRRGDRAMAAQPHEERRTRFRYLGIGHLTAADAYLAASAAARACEERRVAREELRSVAIRHTRQGKEDTCRSRVLA